MCQVVVFLANVTEWERNRGKSWIFQKKTILLSFVVVVVVILHFCCSKTAILTWIVPEFEPRKRWQRSLRNYQNCQWTSLNYELNQTLPAAFSCACVFYLTKQKQRKALIMWSLDNHRTTHSLYHSSIYQYQFLDLSLFVPLLLSFARSDESMWQKAAFELCSGDNSRVIFRKTCKPKSE